MGLFYIMATVYTHVRLDTNEVFYVGISTNNTRPHNKSQRNKLWKGIVSRTKYIVNILYENLSWEEACQKEIDLIKKYGRIDKNTGTLCNLTDGGEGTLNHNHKQETKYKIGLAWKGRKRGPQSEDHKLNMLKTKKINNSFRGAPKGVPKSEETKIKIRKSLSNKQYVCNYCNKIGNTSVMFRWHFENCKQK